MFFTRRTIIFFYHGRRVIIFLVTCSRRVDILFVITDHFLRIKNTFAFNRYINTHFEHYVYPVLFLITVTEQFLTLQEKSNKYVKYNKKLKLHKSNIGKFVYNQLMYVCIIEIWIFSARLYNIRYTLLYINTYDLKFCMFIEFYYQKD